MAAQLFLETSLLRGVTDQQEGRDMLGREDQQRNHYYASLETLVTEREMSGQNCRGRRPRRAAWSYAIPLLSLIPRSSADFIAGPGLIGVNTVSELMSRWDSNLLVAWMTSARPLSY